jgi:hypothetical protein
VAGFCVHGYESSGFIKCGEFVDISWRPINFSRRNLFPKSCIVIFNDGLITDHRELLCFLQNYQYWTLQRLKRDSIIRGSVGVNSTSINVYCKFEYTVSKFDSDFSLTWKHYVVTRVRLDLRWIVVQCLTGTRVFFSFTTRPVRPPGFNSIGTGWSFPVSEGWRLEADHSPQLMPVLRMSGVVPPLPFMVCNRITLPFSLALAWC